MVYVEYYIYMVSIANALSIMLSQSINGGKHTMRNKVVGFANQTTNKFEGEPKAKVDYASKRADGTINTHPQERMRASGQREDDSMDNVSL
jgi:small acid-soluble spore protein K (minor)